MNRIKLIEKEQASDDAKKALDEITKGARVINIFKAMANSSAVLNAYAGIANALSKKTLDSAIAERIGIQLAFMNGCDYCLAAHSYTGAKVMSEDEVLKSRKGYSSDAKKQAALAFAASVMKNAGKVSDEELEKVKNAGFSDGEILEIVTVVALNFFTNSINNVTRTPVDFPKPKD